MKTLVAFLLMFFLAAQAIAGEEKIPLFKQSWYGMDKAAVREASDAGPCEQKTKIDILCGKKNITFGGQEWKQVFRFENGRLDSVLLRKPFDERSFQNVMETISSNDYDVLLISNGTENIDKLVEWSKGPENDANTAMRKFEKDFLSSDRLHYIFFENAGVRKSVEKLGYLSRSIPELLENAPRNLRAVEVIRTKKFLSVIFAALVASTQDNLENVKDTF